MRRPDPTEYADELELYIGQVPETDIVTALDAQAAAVERWPARVPHDKEVLAHAPGIWTPRQVVGHLSDCERIFACRALCFSRRDPNPLPGFDQDPYIAHARYADVPFQALVAEFVALRRANLPLFRRLDEASWSATGVASDHRISVRALAYAMVGHVRHHAALLRERYGLLVD